MKRYFLEKNVFDAYKLYPSNWFEVVKYVNNENKKGKDIKYIDFNGDMYVLNGAENNMKELKKYNYGEFEIVKNVLFTSDTHFSQQRTLELSRRPYKYVDYMNDDIINKWNDLVDKQRNEYDYKDNVVIYHLGDFGDFEVLKRLRGKINLIKGNYEENIDCVGFNNVEDHAVIYVNEIELNLIHEPLKMDKNKFNLFGHIHGLQKVKRNGLNVSVDSHNFSPITFDDVMFYKNAIENHYDDNVFCE